ncbi:MAG: KH domain-containing protein [Candidatus Korarchaeota archaeon]
MRYITHGTIVVPGDKISDDSEIMQGGVYIKDGSYYSNCLGVFEEKEKTPRVTPLVNVYTPRKDDLVIGKVIDVKKGNATVDIGSLYNCILRLKKDVPITVGSVVKAKVEMASRKEDPVLTIDGDDLGVLERGIVLRFPPSKIPRLIGRGGSMISLLKNLLGISIFIGKNGYVWFDTAEPQHIRIAKLVLDKIARESHIPGLTDRIKALLEEEIAKNKK